MQQTEQQNVGGNRNPDKVPQLSADVKQQAIEEKQNSEQQVLPELLGSDVEEHKQALSRPQNSNTEPPAASSNPRNSPTKKTNGDFYKLLCQIHREVTRLCYIVERLNIADRQSTGDSNSEDSEECWSEDDSEDGDSEEDDSEEGDSEENDSKEDDSESNKEEANIRMP